MNKPNAVNPTEWEGPPRNKRTGPAPMLDDHALISLMAAIVYTSKTEHSQLPRSLWAAQIAAQILGQVSALPQSSP